MGEYLPLPSVTLVQTDSLVYQNLCYFISFITMHFSVG